MTPKGEGNSAFYRLAVQLKKAGMRDWEIEATLLDEARHAHSPSDRQADREHYEKLGEIGDSFLSSQVVFAMEAISPRTEFTWDTEGTPHHWIKGKIAD